MNLQREAAITTIQKYVRRFIIRRRYQKQRHQKNFVLLYHSVDKLALERENPFENYNYNVGIWYDLSKERIIFNVTRLLNNKRTYAAKLSHPITTKPLSDKFIREAKALAVSKIPAMYLDKQILQFIKRELTII